MLTREGLFPVGAAAAATVGVGLAAGWLYALAPAALLAWLALLFADRRSSAPGEALALLSPIGGRVLRVDSVEDPWRRRRATRIRVAATWPGVGVVYAPTEGSVVGYWLAGAPFDAGAPAPAPGRSARSPNCYAIGIRTDEGDEVVVALSSPRTISRFRLDVSPGERAGHGRRVGFVYFAGYVDLLAPISTRVTLEEGAAVRAGESVLGSLVRD